MSAICTHTQFHGRAYLSSSSWVSPLTKGLRSLCDPSVLCINIRPFTGRRYLSFGSGIPRRSLQRYWSAPRSIILFRLEPSSALARPDIISFYNDEDVEDNDGYGVAVRWLWYCWADDIGCRWKEYPMLPQFIPFYLSQPRLRGRHRRLSRIYLSVFIYLFRG